ncbi:MAG: hypothetical protein ACI8TX_000221 [Hyphomicrobiaceae bacterium]|jgi:hypothetical protein
MEPSRRHTVARALLVVGLVGLGLLAGGVAPTVAAAVLGPVLLLAPGALVLRKPCDVALAELPALWFAGSLALITATIVLSLLLSLPATGALWLLCGLVLVSLPLASVAGTPNHASKNPQPQTQLWPLWPLWLAVVTCIAVLLFAIAAAWLTQTGSIDRWWYLAYVRRDLLAPTLSASEPFFASGYSPARFVANPWLAAITLWSRASSLDPVAIYEHAAPFLLVPVFVSATFSLGRSVLARSSKAVLLVPIVSLALWTGGLLPVLTRAPEDKFVALLALLPVAAAAAIRTLNGHRNWLPVCAAAALALAFTHALVFALLLAGLAAPILVAGWKKTTAQVVAVLVAGTLLAGAMGVTTRTQWATAGAVVTDSAHPVVRVHASRQRTIAVSENSWIVNPNLLGHPATILALAGLFFTSGLPAVGRSWLLGCTAIALGVAFIPLVADAAGKIVLPWMVYRILWLLPSGILLALATNGAWQRAGKLRPFLAIVLALGAATSGGHALGQRLQPERVALAVPATKSFSSMIAATASLGPEAIVATSSELAERLPALAGVSVLAASDRATFVFSGDPQLALQRLRSRAALAAGVWNPAENLSPTHLLVEPGSPAMSYCGDILFENEEFVLCRFAENGGHSGFHNEAAQKVLMHAAQVAILEGSNTALKPAYSCTAPAERLGRGVRLPRPGAWSAAMPTLTCTFAKISSQHTRLTIVPILGRAREEFVIVARSEAWNEPIARRVSVESGEQIELVLPQPSGTSITVDVTPTFLPFVKLSRLELREENSDDGRYEPLQ